jgi:hypothetical protein
MPGVDLTTVLLIIVALGVVFLVLDFLFAGGGMTLRQAQGRLGAMMGGAAQCGAAMMGSPYGWLLIVALIIIVLAASGFIFR